MKKMITILLLVLMIFSASVLLNKGLKVLTASLIPIVKVAFPFVREQAEKENIITKQRITRITFFMFNPFCFCKHLLKCIHRILVDGLYKLLCRGELFGGRNRYSLQVEESSSVEAQLF